MRKPKTALKKMLTQNICSFKRRVRFNDWTVPGAGTWSQSQYYFRLSQLANYSEITAMFEQYKINAVKLTFQPAFCGDNDVNAAGSATMYIQTPRIYTLIDRDGNMTMATETQALENSAVRLVCNPNHQFSVYISKPCVQLDGAVPKAGQWVDCDNPNYDHWGVAVAGQTLGTSAGFTYQVIATFYMQAKGVK